MSYKFLSYLSGYGFITPKTYEGRAITMVYALIGIPLTFLCLANIGRFMAACFRTMYGRTFCVTCRRNCIECFTTCKSDPELSDVDYDEKAKPHIAQNNETVLIEEKECEESHEETEVPVIVCLILVVWYIIFGAIMFTIWEKHWDIFTGLYPDVKFTNRINRLIDYTIIHVRNNALRLIGNKVLVIDFLHVVV